MAGNTYRCALCGQVYEKAEVSEADALAETQSYWPEVTSLDECDVVCDDCWQQIRPDRDGLADVTHAD